MYSRKMKDRPAIVRPSTSRGRQDQKKGKRGNATRVLRPQEDFEQDVEYDFQGNQQKQKSQQRKFPSTTGYIEALQMKQTNHPSENFLYLEETPALKPKFSHQQNGFQRKTRNSTKLSPLEQARELQGDTRDVRGSKVTHLERSPHFPRKSKVRILETASSSPSVTQFFKPVVDRMESLAGKLFNAGSKRSSQQRPTPNKRSRRTDGQDSLAATPPPADVAEQRKRKRAERKPPPKEMIIDLASDSDTDTDDESSKKKLPQTSKSKPPPTQNGHSAARRSVTNVAAEEGVTRPAGNIYETIHDAVEEANEAMPKTPSDAEKSTPTKHQLHSDVDSDDAGYGTQESSGGGRRPQEKQQSHKKPANSAGETSEDDNGNGNQTEQEDSDSEVEIPSFMVPTAAKARKSKPTPELQKAQHAAKYRKNPDLEAMNYQHHKQTIKRPPRNPPKERNEPIPQETIVLDDEEDENDGGCTSSKYFTQQHEKDDDSTRNNLNHLGDNDMQLIYGKSNDALATSTLPPDLAVGDSGDVPGMMKDFDKKTGQWKNGAKASASLHRDRDSDDEKDYWEDFEHGPIKCNVKGSSYSPQDGDISRMARKMAEDAEVPASTDGDVNVSIRTFARDMHLKNAGLEPPSVSGFSLTKHNNDTVRKKQNNNTARRRGARVVPGASILAKAYSQSPTSSQESREFCDPNNSRKTSSGRTLRSSTKYSSSQEKSDYELAKKLHDQMKTQDDMIANSKRRMSSRIPKKKKSATNVDEPIVLSSDSEDEAPNVDDKDREYPLFRIALGKKVFGNGCRLTFSPRWKDVTLEFSKSGRRTRNSGSENENIRFTLHSDSLKIFKFYRRKASQDNDPFEDDRESADFNFVAIQVSPSSASNLDKYSSSYRPGDKDAPNKQYIVFEFQEDGDFEHFLAEMELHLAEILPPGEIKNAESLQFVEALVEHSRRMINTRRAKQSQSAFIKGRNGETKLLVFPFAGDPAQIKAAANGLREPSGKLKTIRGYISDSSDEESDEKETNKSTSASSRDADDSNEGAVPKVKVRQHYVTLCVEDYERLQPREWLNDSLIDFWMQWISRSEDKSKTNLHFFTSHFYSALSRDGPDAVTSWTAKKNINIFEKKFIFIPINKDLHWSQCVVVNPGSIMNAYEADLDKKAKLDIPCLIFMDSLSMHKKATIRKKIENWLNSEYRRIHPDAKIEKPFDKDRFELFTPKVPMQNNTWDCGVFVCRYALAIFKLRNRSFTFRDVHGNSPFSRIVAGGAEFDFNMDDIVRFRGEFQTLIERLSRVYAKWKREGENPNQKVQSEKNGEGEVNAEQQKNEKETSDEHGMNDEAMGYDKVTGSPEEVSMDIVKDNERASIVEENESAPQQGCVDI